MTRTMPRIFVLVGLLLARVQTVRADLIEWTFSSSPTPALVSSNNHRLGDVHLMPTAGTAYGSTNVILANLLTISTAPATAPDDFSQRAFSITLTITDLASKVSGKVTFTGVINGTDSLYSSLLTFQITSATTQRLHLGFSIFDITIDNLTPPGPTNAASYGSIGAMVEVTHNPEPASLVLGCIGAAGVGLVRWKGRRSPPENG